MTSRLPDEVVNQLVHLLGSLARGVAKGMRLGEEQLRLLLQSVFPEPVPSLVEEMELWQNLLFTVREQPTEENRFIVAEALKIRGVPPAPIQLALDTLCRNSPSPFTTTSAPQLNTVIRALHLRHLPPGQEVVLELEVQGASGRVEVDSDFVLVSPAQFSAEGTVIEVRVKPLPEGMLTPTLRLITEDESLELPLLVEWERAVEHVPPSHPEPLDSSSEASPSAPQPQALQRRELTVALDGSGQFTRLEEAVQAAAPGDTIRLKAGVYLLSHPIDITKPLSLIGEGMDNTRVFCEAEGHVVYFSNDGQFRAEGIEFAHGGKRPAHVLAADRGQVWLTRCRFTGAVWGRTRNIGGCGLKLSGTVRGQVMECHVVGNDWGITVTDEAAPVLEANICQRNNYQGIVCAGQASGLVRKNMCAENNLHGITVDERAQPTLESNTCQRNKQTGIAYFGEAAGVARENNCAENNLASITKASACMNEPNPRWRETPVSGTSELASITLARRLGSRETTTVRRTTSTASACMNEPNPRWRVTPVSGTSKLASLTLARPLGSRGKTTARRTASTV
jgi:parallel beta-helix repeat protein